MLCLCPAKCANPEDYSYYLSIFMVTVALDLVKNCSAFRHGGYLSPGASVQCSRSVVSDSLRPHESQHVRPPCPSPSPGVHSDSRPSSPWCHPAISSSVVPLPSISPSIRVFSNESTLHMRWPKYWSFSFSIIPSKETPGLISLQSKGLSRVFSNTTVQKHQFFGAQLSSQSNSHIHTWLLEKP